jgi:hypothetical protein
MKYIIVSGKDIKDLQEQVNKYLEHDMYVPTGGLIVEYNSELHVYRYCQAMVSQ